MWLKIKDERVFTDANYHYYTPFSSIVPTLAFLQISVMTFLLWLGSLHWSAGCILVVPPVGSGYVPLGPPPPPPPRHSSCRSGSRCWARGRHRCSLRSTSCRSSRWTGRLKQKIHWLIDLHIVWFLYLQTNARG